MALTIAEVEHIARLASLNLTSEEITRFRAELSEILDYVERLSELDTAGVAPTASVLAASSPLREDTARPGLPSEELLSNAPETTKGQFKVPPVLQ